MVPKSKYQEDVYVNGHTTVYGSYFKGGTWGYKCCGALQKQAYCTGAASRSGADTPQQAPEPEPTGASKVDRTRPLIEVSFKGEAGGYDFISVLFYTEIFIEIDCQVLLTPGAASLDLHIYFYDYLKPTPDI